MGLSRAEWQSIAAFFVELAGVLTIILGIYFMLENSSGIGNLFITAGSGLVAIGALLYAKVFKGPTLEEILSGPDTVMVAVPRMYASSRSDSLSEMNMSFITGGHMLHHEREAVNKIDQTVLTEDYENISPESYSVETSPISAASQDATTVAFDFRRKFIRTHRDSNSNIEEITDE